MSAVFLWSDHAGVEVYSHGYDLFRLLFVPFVWTVLEVGESVAYVSLTDCCVSAKNRKGPLELVLL